MTSPLNSSRSKIKREQGAAIEKVKKYIEDKTLAKELYYNSGLSACQIAVQLRLSHSTVKRMLDDKDPMGVRKFLKLG